jgi:hypothetical protein
MAAPLWQNGLQFDHNQQPSLSDNRWQLDQRRLMPSKRFAHRKGPTPVDRRSIAGRQAVTAQKSLGE